MRLSCPCGHLPEASFSVVEIYSCLMFFTGFSLLAIQLCTATAAKLISMTITPAATIHGHHTMR